MVKTYLEKNRDQKFMQSQGKNEHTFSDRVSIQDGTYPAVQG